MVDLSNPNRPTKLFTIPTAPYGGGANSVAIRAGIVAAAVEATPKTDPGSVVFFDTDGNFIRRLTIGALPDMLTFSPDGRSVRPGSDTDAILGCTRYDWTGCRAFASK